LAALNVLKVASAVRKEFLKVASVPNNGFLQAFGGFLKKTATNYKPQVLMETF
jgi:hypothetical protein